MLDPFAKSLSQLTKDDLLLLRERYIAEGLYIEYKSDFPSPIKVSHSIASFANSHGGWYIIGIKTDSNNIPQDYPGFLLTQHRESKEEIRNICRDHIDPFPNFESTLIPLDGDHSIIVVLVPESDDTPHITKDGRIYRRNSEGSDPIPETDRHVIDQLYDRGKQVNESIERFCYNEIQLSKAEEKMGWLEIYALTYPFDKLRIEGFFRDSEVSALKRELNSPASFAEGFTLGFNFNTIHPSIDSIVFRITTPDTIAYHGLTFRIYPNGNSKMVIPFPYNDLLSKSKEELTPVESSMLSRLSTKDFDLYRIVNGFQLLTLFLTLLAKYFDYVKSKGWRDNVMLVYRMENTWRNILQIESKSFQNQIEKYGLPVCQYNSGRAPPKIEKRRLLRSLPETNLDLFHEFLYVAEHFGRLRRNSRTMRRRLV